MVDMKTGCKCDRDDTSDTAGRAMWVMAGS